MSSHGYQRSESNHPGDITQAEAAAGILPSHGISIDVPGDTDAGRPPIVHHLSQPAYKSPLRHHRRAPSYHRDVKETLNARSAYTNNEEDGRAEHHINQYIIKHEIGRGSFGAVHLAVDQYGTEYAVKEFSKSRLRRRAQSNILRRPPGSPKRPGHLAAGKGFNAPLHRHSSSDLRDAEHANPLFLIKEEIAIMKKLDHPNLVSLIEVLDDPEEDSIYMVLEMCKKGVVMKVGLNEKADPYDNEHCRCWFRDMILGIEYLHAQGVVHRDIKPDNLLLTEDDVLKIVDFGVSEMFEKESDMKTAKSAGSPAFLPPELCVSKHGDISGKAADIWSMGASLYCLKFGQIPFERTGVLEVYEAIRNGDLKIDPDEDPQFIDLMHKLLEKDPEKRIRMSELREHPWVTKDGTDPLLSAEENTADLVEMPTEKEINHAITEKMRNLLVMMRAVHKFKALLDAKRPHALSSILSSGTRTLNTPGLNSVTQYESSLHYSQSTNTDNRRKIESALATEGVHHDISPRASQSPSTMDHHIDSSVAVVNTPQKAKLAKGRETSHSSFDSLGDYSKERGHAHDILDEEPLFLGIGAGSAHSNHTQDPSALAPPEQNIVAESPTVAEFSIYDTAYQEEVERIRASQGQSATVYLTRRVDEKEKYKSDQHMVDLPSPSKVAGQPHEGWRGLVDKAREKSLEPMVVKAAGGTSLGDVAAKAVENTRDLGSKLKSGRSGEGRLGGLVQHMKELGHGKGKGDEA